MMQSHDLSPTTDPDTIQWPSRAATFGAGRAAPMCGVGWHGCLSRHDGVSGLPGQRLFVERLERHLTIAPAGDRSGVLFLLDLSQLQAVRRRLGHASAEAILRQAADRLQAEAPEMARLARLCGDRFAVFQPGEKAIRAMETTAERLLERLADPFGVTDGETVCPAICAAVVGPEAGEDAARLLERAGCALAQVLVRGEHGLGVAVRAERPSPWPRPQQRLHRALVEERLHLWFQPQLDLRSGTIVGIEALLRWPEGASDALATPDVAALADRPELLRPLGQWLLETGCGQLRCWHETGCAPRYVAINLLPCQFTSPGLVDDVVTALARFDLAPDALILEITESGLMPDTAATRATLGGLEALGVRLAIDDFGAGHSSLRYLKRFTAHQLKIDRAFIHDVAAGNKARAIVGTLLALGERLGLEVVAEGVETAEQLSCLAALGCRVVQGYYVAPPMSADACTALLRTGIDRELLRYDGAERASFHSPSGDL